MIKYRTTNKAVHVGIGCLAIVSVLLYLAFWIFIGVSIVYSIAHFLFHWV